VVLYTDGISEAANAENEQFGDPRVSDCVLSLPTGMPAKEVAEHVIGTLHEFLGGVEPQDDITLLILRVLEPVSAGQAREPVPEAVEAR